MFFLFFFYGLMKKFQNYYLIFELNDDDARSICVSAVQHVRYEMKCEMKHMYICCPCCAHCQK